MDQQHKFRVQPAMTNTIIYWCIMLIFLFLGLIIQFETTGFSWIGMIFWLIAISLTIYGVLGFKLELLFTEKSLAALKYHRAFGRTKLLSIKNIKKITILNHNVRITMIKPGYLHYDILMSRKKMNKFLETMNKNRVTIVDVDKVLIDN
ncbi:EbsA family protein [Agrilactobacillus fermenti]|uniref:EbsA family protein n=1 Tax=Agrilactobacillus fermenti TaxID=2586909 RepID=UPI003A5B999F